MRIKTRRAKERKLKQHRELLVLSVRDRLLPAILDKGFALVPSETAAVHHFPFGRLTRARGKTLDMIEIQFSSHSRAAFRINACAIPQQGMITLGGHVSARYASENGVHNLEMYDFPRLWRFFSLWFWYLRKPKESSYEKLVIRVIRLLPELELALTEGKLGPHIRRLEIVRPAAGNERTQSP